MTDMKLFKLIWRHNKYGSLLQVYIHVIRVDIWRIYVFTQAEARSGATACVNFLC
jgi:hypothetical protein